MAKMVDISEKHETQRKATARATVLMNAQVIKLIKEDKIPKGDVFTISKISGISAAKQTAHIIPMCHPILIDSVDIEFEIDEETSQIEIQSQVSATGKTGVEMEALTAVAVAALTIYDMCKPIDRGITIKDIRLIRKSGGKSGEFVRE